MAINDVTTVVRKFKCDNTKNCKKEAQWNPAVGPTEKLPKMTDDIVVVQHAASGKTTTFCCDTCAVEGVGDGVHLPTPVPSIQIANDADAKQIIAASEATKRLKVN